MGEAEFEDDNQIDDGTATPYEFDYELVKFNGTTIELQLIFDNPS